MEGAFEWEGVDGGGDEDLAAGGGDVQLWQELARKGVRTYKQLGGDQREGVLAVEQQMAARLFVTGDIDVVEDGDAEGLYEAQQGLTELARMQLAFGPAF